MRISVFASDELAGAILLLKNMDRDLAKQIRRAVKEIGQSEWQEAVRGYATTGMEVAVLANTTTATHAANAISAVLFMEASLLSFMAGYIPALLLLNSCTTPVR